MRKIIFILLSLVNYVSLTAQSNKIIIYEDSNYGASYLELNSDWQANNKDQIWNDKISSIRIPEGVIIVIYENCDYSGAHKVLNRDWKAIDDEGSWDNKISSIQFIDENKPYTMIYHCYLQDGTKDAWQRTNDLVMNYTADSYFGIDKIINPTIDTTNLSFGFTLEKGNKVNANISIDGNEVHGWIQQANKIKQNLYGVLKDITPIASIPQKAQGIINEYPKTVKKSTSTNLNSSDIKFPVSTYSDAIKVYKNADFTGESRYVDGDWTFGDINKDADFFDWWRQIRSIRIPEGWEIICYSDAYYMGDQIRLTNDWIPEYDSKWKENIRSIKIVRKGMLDYWGNLLNKGVIVYKEPDFTGESRYVDRDWSFGDITKDADFFDWWRQIKSIRVPEGWAIICFRYENFSGDSIQITGNWIPANDPKWKENIKSIKLVRRGK
jgi:hypothetical protein